MSDRKLHFFRWTFLIGIKASAESETTGQKQHRRHDQRAESDDQEEYTSGLVDADFQLRAKVTGSNQDSNKPDPPPIRS